MRAPTFVFGLSCAWLFSLRQARAHDHQHHHQQHQHGHLHGQHDHHSHQQDYQGKETQYHERRRLNSNPKYQTDIPLDESGGIQAVLPDKHSNKECGVDHLVDKADIVVEETRLYAALQRAANHHDNPTTVRRYGRNLQDLDDSCQQISAACNQCIDIRVNLGLIGFVATDEASGQSWDLLPHPTDVMIDVITGDAPVNPNTDFSSVSDIQDLFAANLQVLNDAFVDSPFNFVWDRNADTRVEYDGSLLNVAEKQQEVTDAVGIADLMVLNVFVGFNVIFVEDAIVFGLANFAAAQRVGKGDGVYLRYDVLTNGGFPTTDGGYTLVHEVGHWLGLWHTFQQWLATTTEVDPCFADEQTFNDFVADTPQMAGASQQLGFVCTNYLSGSVPNTCPLLPGSDPFFNYMNYLDQDFCYEQKGEFTCNQIERMYKEWLLFRDVVSSCEDESTHGELEIIFSLDQDYVEDIISVVLLSQDNEVIWESFTDHYFSYRLYQDVATMDVDLCLRRDETYQLIVLDIGGQDGFTDGRIDIIIDGVAQTPIQGNFGARTEITIEFGNGPGPSPTPRPTPQPTPEPTPQPTPQPNPQPTTPPTPRPTPQPNPQPTPPPTPRPTPQPNPQPTPPPTPRPTPQPNPQPTPPPTPRPTPQPNPQPTPPPTESPTDAPTIQPTERIDNMPTAPPTNSPQTSGFTCRNSQGWYFTRSDGTRRGCGWVGRNPERRCRVRGRGNRRAWEACPLACGDSSSWKFVIRPNSNDPQQVRCGWVGRKPSRRCRLPGGLDGRRVPAFAACAETCCRYNKVMRRRRESNNGFLGGGDESFEDENYEDEDYDGEGEEFGIDKYADEDFEEDVYYYGENEESTSMNIFG